jgi:hypothetical protein
MYNITNYTRTRAKTLGVTVKPSKNKKKKLDVYNKKGVKIASVGAIGYMDFPSFIKSKGRAFANKRRIAYKKRHEKNRKIVGSNGYYADKLLW